MQVKPVLQRLKTTLTASGLTLLLSTVLLFGLIRSGSDADGQYGVHTPCAWFCGPLGTWTYHGAPLEPKPSLLIQSWLSIWS